MRGGKEGNYDALATFERSASVSVTVCFILLHAHSISVAQ